MNIKYVFNPDTEATGAVAIKYAGSCAEGIEPMIAAGLVNKGYVKPAELVPIQTIRTWAKPKDGVDTFDENVGKEVARDKLLIAYYNRLAAKHDAYVKALEKELASATRNANYIKKKKKNAEERLKMY